MRLGNRQKIKVLKKLDSENSLLDNLKNINELIEELNTKLPRSSFLSLFDCQILEKVEIPATTNLRIRHNLKVKPKYRLILRQRGGGIIQDIDTTAEEWNENYITLRNNGGTATVLTVALFKE